MPQPQSQNPYAAYGGTLAPQGPPADPYAAYGGQMQAAPVHQQPAPHSTYMPSTGTISAYTPSLWDRAKNVVANSAVGHALEQGLPSVADTLGLHPTETVNSPTYEADKGQLLAPQYLAPAPTSAAGHVARGVLTGAGQLTSAKNIAIGTGIAATGGLAAPLAASAGTVGAVARAGGMAARAGLAAVGAKGVYSDASHAVQQYKAGDTAGALESAGAALPNAALTLPALGEPLEAVGDAAQRGGVGIINRTIGARKADFARGANPGEGYFQAGLGPSASMDSIAAKTSDALKGTGQNIGNVSSAYQAKGGLIPYDQGAAPIQSAITRARSAMSGPGGTGSTAPIDAFESTWQPLLDAAQKRGGFLPEEYAAAKRNTAQNTTWGDPTQAGMREARQQTVGGMGGALVDSMPELGPLNKQYQNLSKLAPLAQYRADTGSMPLARIVDKGLLGLTGAGAGAMSHDPLLSAAAGLGSMAMDSVPVRTGVASGLYYGGQGLKRVGAGLSALPSLLTGSKNEQGLQGDENGNHDAGDSQPSQYGPQSNPQASPYSLRNLTPEIIRPNSERLGNTGMGGMFARPLRYLPAPAAVPDFSYSVQGVTPDVIDPSRQSLSRIPVGPDGRAGTLIRPFGMLPASVQPPALGPHAATDVAPLYAAPQKDMGAPADRAPGARLDGVDGSDAQLYTPTGQIPARYRVVEGNSVVTSHNPNTFAPNPAYPAGVQERDYGQKEAQSRVIHQAQNFRPELTLSDDPSGQNGPPIITPDGIALGGNSRAMSTVRQYASGGSAYRDALLAKAPSLGLDPEAIKGMDRPMLVREVNPGGGVNGMRSLGSDLNKSLTGSLQSSERAVSMGKNLSPDTLHSVQAMMDDMGGNASLRDVLNDPTRANALLRRMQEDGAITPQERPGLIDTSTGGLSEEGKRLTERALLGAAIQNPALMDAAPKNVVAKLNGSLGPLASLAGRSDTWNVLPEVQRALEAHADMATKGMGVNDYLNQRGLLGGHLSPTEEAMTRVLAQNPTAVRKAFSTYAADARYAIPGQTSFLGPNPEQAFWHAFGDQPKQQDAAPAAPALRAKPNGLDVSTLLARPPLGGLAAIPSTSRPLARVPLPTLIRGMYAQGDAA